ncbi:hypothetical protein [Actinomadura darangshiensis]|nr:hypothetical protein [Actinomadura darangshiensis]
MYAPETVRTLHGVGNPAHALRGGPPEWRRAGLPVITAGDRS